ncbi:hypothetical protein LPN04_31215 [Rugamonas sp. A1-17]|nr:hypothetical protein [Rugamonas sp. A1-17]
MQTVQFGLGQDITDISEAAIETLIALIKRGHGLALLCSGGKDSSCVTILGLEAIRRATAAGIVQSQHYLSTSETTIENPSMVQHVLRFLNDIENYCALHNMPIDIHITQPSLASQFVVSTIGRGTLVRTVQNSVKDGASKRQCSDDWKVQPQIRLKKKIAQDALSKGFREPISVLGTRFAENTTRAGNMTARGERSDVATRGANGDLTVSVIAKWSTDEVWTFLSQFTDESMYPFPSPASARSIIRLHELYRDASDGVFGVVLGDGGTKKACGARHGCTFCLIAGEQDKSMESMVREPQHAHMAGLNRYRNYLAATQWDLNAREIVGRTISKAGYVRIQPDVYSFEHRMRLLRYLLTLDAIEVDRAEVHEAKLWSGLIPDTEANRELCEIQFEMINLQQLVAIDFQLGMHQYCPHAHPANSVWYEIRTLGRRYDIPDVPVPAVKQPIPSYGWYEVGQFDKMVPTEGLRDYANELWNPYLHSDRVSAYAQTTDAERVTYFEEEDQLAVDAELACSFVTCTFDATYHQQVQSFTGLEGVRFWLNEAILKLPKGMSAKYQYMAKRGEYFSNLVDRLNIASTDLENYLKANSITDAAHQALLEKASANSYPLLSLSDDEPAFVVV